MSAFSNYLSLYIGTNYVPHISKEAVRELLQEPEQRIQLLEKEIQDATLALQAATQKRDAFVSTHAAAVLKRPFDALSDETLSEIFLASLPGPTERYPSLRARSAPLIFGHICRRWRRVAFEQTPRLWSSICISLPPAISQTIEFGQVGVPRSYVRYTYEFVFTKEASAELHRSVSAQCVLISQWLTRSASLPLSIFIRTTETNPVVSAYLQPYLDTLLEFSSRWETLKVIIPSGNLLDSLCAVPSSQVPRLKNLMLRLSYQRCRNNQSDAWCASGIVRAPSLQRLSMDLPYPTDETHHLPLNGMTHLSFNPNPNGSRNGSSPTRFTVPAAKGLLLDTPYIVDLTLELCEPRPVPKMFTPNFVPVAPYPVNPFIPISHIPQPPVAVISSSSPYTVPPTVLAGIPWLQPAQTPSVPPGATLVSQSTTSANNATVVAPADAGPPPKTETTDAPTHSLPSSSQLSIPTPTVPSPWDIPHITITPPSTDPLLGAEDEDIAVLVRPATPQPATGSTQPGPSTSTITSPSMAPPADRPRIAAGAIKLAGVPSTNESMIPVPTQTPPTQSTSTPHSVGFTFPPLPPLPQPSTHSQNTPLPSLSHLQLPTLITSPPTGSGSSTNLGATNAATLQNGPTTLNHPPIHPTPFHPNPWPPSSMTPTPPTISTPFPSTSSPYVMTFPPLSPSPQPIAFDQLVWAQLFDSDPGRTTPSSPTTTFLGPLTMSELAKVPRIDLVHLETLEIVDVALDAEELFATLNVPNLKHLVYYGMNRQRDGPFSSVERTVGGRRRRRAAFLTLLDPRDGPAVCVDNGVGEVPPWRRVWDDGGGMGCLPEPVLHDDTVSASVPSFASSRFPASDPFWDDSSTYTFTSHPSPPRGSPTPTPSQTQLRIQPQLEHLPPRCNLTSLTLDLYTLQLSDLLECIQLTPELTHFTHRNTAPHSYSGVMHDTTLEFVDWEPVGRNWDAPIIRNGSAPGYESGGDATSVTNSENQGVAKGPGVLLVGKASPGVVYHSGFNVGLSVPVSVVDCFVRILTPEGMPAGVGGAEEDKEEDGGRGVVAGSGRASEKPRDEEGEDAEGDADDEEMHEDDDNESGTGDTGDDRMDTDDDDEPRKRWTWKEKGKEKEHVQLEPPFDDPDSFTIHSPSDTISPNERANPTPTIHWPKLTHLNIIHPVHLSDNVVLEFLQQRRRWAKAGTRAAGSNHRPDQGSDRPLPPSPSTSSLERVKVDVSHPTPYSPTPLFPSPPASPTSSFSSSSSFYSPPASAPPFPAITGPWPESTNPRIKAGLKRCVERMEGFVLELRYLPPVYDFSRSFEPHRGVRRKGVLMGTRWVGR